jgi:hypothetical protein
MFILLGSNNYNTSPVSLGAHIQLVTNHKVGAHLCTIGTPSTSELTFPTPELQNGLYRMTTPPGIKAIAYVDLDGYRYVPTTGTLQPGEFFWDKENSILSLKPYG